jgi:tetratricopeptide (TPR) repeat protein
MATSATGTTAKDWKSLFQNQTDSFLVGSVFVAAILFGIICIYLQGALHPLTAQLWALACLSVGAVVGFLFGIPKVLQDGSTSKPADAAHTTAGNGSAGKGRVAPNTNLEQISDWLTKILVGIGLVQLAKVPGYLDTLGLYIAKGVGAEKDLALYQSFAVAASVYFAVTGFLGVYLLTRLFLQGAIDRSDLGLSRGLDAVPALAKQEVDKVPVQIGDKPDQQGLAAASKAAATITDVPMTELRSTDEFGVWAKAQALRGNYGQAVNAYRKAIDLAPNDPKLRLEYADALHQAGASEADVYDQLIEAYKRVSPRMDPDLKASIYASLTYCCLYLAPPQGFEQAIHYGEEYTADPNNPPSDSVWVNLAAAYGQQAKWMKAQDPSADIGQLRAKALEAGKKAIALDPQNRSLLRGLLDPTPQQKHNSEDDLDLFKDDPDFRREWGI